MQSLNAPNIATIEHDGALILNRLDEYQLYVREDGQLLCEDDPISLNQLKCMLKHDLKDKFQLSGKQLDKLIDRCFAVSIRVCLRENGVPNPLKTRRR